MLWSSNSLSFENVALIVLPALHSLVIGILAPIVVAHLHLGLLLSPEHHHFVEVPVVMLGEAIIIDKFLSTSRHLIIEPITVLQAALARGSTLRSLWVLVSHLHSPLCHWFSCELRSIFSWGSYQALAMVLTACICVCPGHTLCFVMIEWGILNRCCLWAIWLTLIIINL